MVAGSVVPRRTCHGFSTAMLARDARRQLRLSVGVVVVLGMGIVSAAVAVGAHPIAAKRDVVSTSPVVVLHAEAAPIGAEAI